MKLLCFFSRGKGPLKNASDVISAAKKIAEAGSRMDKLGRAIADQVSWTSLLQEKYLFSWWIINALVFHLRILILMKHSSEMQQCIIYLPANSYPWLFPSTFRKLRWRPWCKRRHYGSVNPIPVVQLFPGKLLFILKLSDNDRFTGFVKIIWEHFQ